MTTKKDTASFEETLAELESIVDEMENGDLPLNKALEKFERGIALSRQGQKSLENAEQKVQNGLDHGTFMRGGISFF